MHFKLNTHKNIAQGVTTNFFHRNSVSNKLKGVFGEKMHNFLFIDISKIPKKKLKAKIR
jgi:hypothetical protein